MRCELVLHVVQLQCFRDGVVRSTSLLVNGASAKTAAQAAVKAGLQVGLHLNLTEGAPVAGADAVSSLVDADSGHMLGKMGFRDALSAGSIDDAHVRRLHSEPCPVGLCETACDMLDDNTFYRYGWRSKHSSRRLWSLPARNRAMWMGTRCDSARACLRSRPRCHYHAMHPPQDVRW